MKKTGVVCLVGAGPGDPGLITGKGLMRLRTCDAVVYDSLASERFLEEVRPEAKKIYVGKRAGAHSMKQAEINKLLVELAEEGLFVVRLKGGDPFVFGRGGEEIMALSLAGIPYEVVSGVTSAVAALASAGIPLTHRAVSRSFHVMTGHTLSEEGTLPDDFEAFVGLKGTLVFLMGLGNLSLIVDGLLKQGKSEETPAAVIQNGTLPEQKTVRGTLKNIREKVKAAGIASPAIIVVGETAALDFSSTYRQPLGGCRIGVTGTENFGVRLLKELESLGGTCSYILRLSMKSRRGEESMKKAYKQLSAYTWIVFTSANGVKEFFLGLLEQGYDFRSVGHVKFAVVGKGTAEELRNHGFFADYIPEKYQVKDLAEGLRSLISENDRILIPRSSGGSKELNDIFDEAGIFYDDVILYGKVNLPSGQREDPLGGKVNLPSGQRENLLGEMSWNGMGEEQRREALKDLDYIAFASASGVEAFFQGAEKAGKQILEGKKVACIGDMTAKALMEYGKNADVVADVYTALGLSEAICRDWNKGRKDS